MTSINGKGYRSEERSIEIDDWADETKVSPKILKNELIYRNKALEEYESLDLSKIKIGGPLPTELIQERPSEVIFQKFQENPQSIFMFEYEGRRVLGKKYMSDLCLAYGIPITFLFCSHIKAPMLLGLVEREQLTQDGVLVFFKSFTVQEKATVFAHLVGKRTTDIYFPYTQLLTDQKLEQTTPEDGWVYCSERGNVMTISETEQRLYTVRVLGPIIQKMMLDGLRPQLFDPACSNGEFLAHVQQAYPNVVTIGQDLSPSMVKEAKTKLDLVYLGDSISSPVENESMDIIFFRFLNVDVVTTEQAYNLLISLIKKVKKDGYVVVIGYTPVLVTSAIMQRIGLKFIQANGVTEDQQVLFQYYIFRRGHDLKEISYSEITSNKFLYG